MSDLSQITARLKIDEGFGPYVFLDTRGYSTLGYGICVDERGGVPISDAIATAWLEERATAAQATAEAYPWWPNLDNARGNLVVCLLYNMGKPRFDTFVQLQAALGLRPPDYATAATQLVASEWYGQVGDRGPLYATIMASGVWPA